MDGYYQTQDDGICAEAIFILIAVVVVIVIIGYYLLRGNTSNRGFTWVITSGSTTSGETFSGAAGNAYLSNPSITGTFNLTIVAPTSPAIGQEFILINKSAATLNCTPALTVKPNTSVTCVWSSDTAFIPIIQSIV